ncbi:MAG: PEP-utilizing enzyme [Candidatus Magasanikiibacteriota bacterium]
MIKARVINPHTINGTVVYYKNDNTLGQSFYDDKIVIIDDINISEIINILKNCAGIIAEKGGITSHGATLAREHQIPTFVLLEAKNLIPENTKLTISELGEIDLPKIENITKKQNKKPELVIKDGWFLAKVKKGYTPLILSLKEKGVKDTPKILFGNKNNNVTIKVDEIGFWLKNHPNYDDIENTLVTDKVWFKKFTKHRAKIYSELKKYLNKTVDKIQKDKLKNYSLELEKIYQQYTTIQPYLFVSSYALDYLEEQFVYKLEKILNQTEINKLTDNLFRSSYSHSIASYDIDLPSLHSVTQSKFQDTTKIFHIKKIKKIKKKIPDKQITTKIKNLNNKTSLDILQYIKFLPVLTDMSDENCYLSRTLGYCLKSILKKVEPIVLDKNDDKKKIESCTISEIIEKLKK